MIPIHGHRLKIIFWLTLLLITASSFLSLERYMIKKDYLIEAKLICNPDKESCFAEECDTSDPRCPGNDGIFYFKIVNKKANVPTPLSECSNRNQCQTIYCNDNNLIEYSEFESCTYNPIRYD